MNFAIILSGGIGTRMGKDIPKQYITVKNKPILVYTLERFQAAETIDKIVIVAAREWHDTIIKWADEYHITKFAGLTNQGATRQRSVQSGVLKCYSENCGNDDIVLVHDGVRPLVSVELINKVVSSTKEYNMALPVIPLKDTVYQSFDRNIVGQLLPRETLFAGQSPEGFNLAQYMEITDALSEEELDSYTGTSALVYSHNKDVKLVEGEELNYKLTTPEDLERFANYIENDKS